MFEVIHLDVRRGARSERACDPGAEPDWEPTVKPEPGCVAGNQLDGGTDA